MLSYIVQEKCAGIRRLWLPGIVLMLAYVDSYAQTLQVTELSPSPNYSYTASSKQQNELDELTDGSTSRRDMWTRKGSVGWVRRSPVTVQLKSSGEFDPMPQKLRFHTVAKDDFSAAALRRADVFCRTQNQHELVLIGSQTFDLAAMQKSRDSVWQELPLSRVCHDMVAVLHSGGTVLVVDELEIRPSAHDSAAASALPTAPVNDALAASDQLFRAEAVGRQRDVESAIFETISSTGTMSLIEPVDPYGTMRAVGIGQATARFHDMVGFCGAAEPFAFLLANPDSTAREFSISVDIAAPDSAIPGPGEPADASGSAKIFQVLPVVAMDGSVVFDPLMPLTDGKARLEAASFARIFVDLPLPDTGLAAGTSVVLTVNDGARSETRRFNVACIEPQPVEATYATVWAYDSDKPVMAAREAALADLLEHKVNVNVIHPGELPGEPGKSWNAVKALKLLRRLEEFPDDTVHLVALGWPARLQRIAANEREAVVEAWIKTFASWSSRVQGDMTWLLYPTDEPRGKMVDQLVEYVRQFRRNGVDLPVYVNPLASTSRGELEDLAEVADYWQPTLDAIQKNRAFFSRIKPDKLWLYQNPVFGPKRESPWHYRLLGWWAAHLDARGVGFWSYSSTSESSAWSDFDGLHPDWSVVYEADSGIISSRRWEAFADGVGDLRLFLARQTRCGAATPDFPIDAVKARDSEELVAYRTRMFEFDCLAQ